MNITIPDDYQDCVRHLKCFESLHQHSVQIFNDTVKDLASLAARFADTDALLLTRERTHVSADLLDLLPRLRLINQTGIVGANLDLAACTQRGIAVVESKAESTATSELAWALILASRRHLVVEANRLREGNWQGFLGQQLRGQRIGIWSYGRVGKQIAEYGKAFGMHVWVWGSDASTSKAVADGLSRAPSREAFFAESDIISLHVRLFDETRGIVTRRDLDLMKNDALFVNTSRAELIQPGALEAALRQGRPGYVAVDVFEAEPVLGADHPLLNLPNALCTPHIGFVERDNYEAFYDKAFNNILNYAEGKPLTLVNPEVLVHPRQQDYANQ